MFLPIDQTVLTLYVKGNININPENIVLGATTLDGVFSDLYYSVPEEVPDLKEHLTKWFTSSQTSSLINHIATLIEATSNVTAITLLNGYACFNCDTRFMAKILPGARLYQYGLPRNLPRVINYFGVEEGLSYHADDLNGLFRWPESYGVPYDQNMSSIMISLFTDFAKNDTAMINNWPMASNDSNRVEGYWYFDAKYKYVDGPFDSWDICDTLEKNRTQLQAFCYSPFI